MPFYLELKNKLKIYKKERKILQLTHFTENLIFSKIKNKNNKQIIPILLTVFSVFYFFKNLNIIISLQILFIYFFNSLLNLNIYTFRHLNSFSFNRLLLCMDNIYYSSITTDRDIFYEKVYKISIKNDISYFPNIYFKLYSLFNNYTYLYLDNLNEFLYLVVLVLVPLFYLILLYKIKKLLSILFIYLLFIVIPMSLFMLGVDIYFYDYSFFFTMFKINESFLNRNIYIDSNYFLTSDSLRGIEKFTDISVPWSIDYEDYGWGGDFDIQSQIDIWKEHEHKFITEDIDLVYSPYLEHNETVEGSFSMRFIKIKQRWNFWIEMLEKFSEVDSEIWSSWKLKNIISYNTDSKLNKSFIFNFFEFSNLQSYNTNGFLLKGEKKITKQIKKYLYSNSKSMGAFNDFYLPKKNNITNENFNQAGNISDRKQIVFRNINNSLDTVDKLGNVKYRRPDITLDTNYIFERQLQNFRINEYNIKEKIYKYFELKWKTYNTGKLGYLKKQNIFTINNFNYNIDKVDDTLSKVLIKTKYLNFDGLCTKLPNYSHMELKLENIVKYWNSNTIENTRIFPRTYEYVYLRQNQKFICGFNNITNQVDEVLEFLAKNNQLGLGSYTYQSLEGIPWGLESLELFEFFNKCITTLLAKDKISYWLSGKNKLLYNNLIVWIDKYFNEQNINIKKKFLILFTKRFINTWSYLNNTSSVCNFEYIYLIIFYEFLLENYKNSVILNTIASNYVNTLEKIGIGNLKIKNNWRYLVDLKLKKIKEKNSIVDHQMGISKNVNFNNFKLKNVNIDKYLDWKNKNNYNIFKYFTLNERILLNAITKSISINEHISNFGYPVNFNNKNYWKYIPIYKKKINNLNNNMILDKNFLIKKNNYQYFNSFLNVSEEANEIKNIKKQLSLNSMFFYREKVLIFFNYLNYFFFSYRDIFLKKMFFVGQRFKYINKNKITKKIFITSFKFLEFPIPIFSNPMKIKEFGQPITFYKNFWVKRFYDYFFNLNKNIFEISSFSEYYKKLYKLLNQLNKKDLTYFSHNYKYTIICFYNIFLNTYFILYYLFMSSIFGTYYKIITIDILWEVWVLFIYLYKETLKYIINWTFFNLNSIKKIKIFENFIFFLCSIFYKINISSIYTFLLLFNISCFNLFLKHSKKYVDLNLISFNFRTVGTFLKYINENVFEKIYNFLTYSLVYYVYKIFIYGHFKNNKIIETGDNFITLYLYYIFFRIFNLTIKFLKSQFNFLCNILIIYKESLKLFYFIFYDSFLELFVFFSNIKSYFELKKIVLGWFLWNNNYIKNRLYNYLTNIEIKYINLKYFNFYRFVLILKIKNINKKYFSSLKILWFWFRCIYYYKIDIKKIKKTINIYFDDLFIDLKIIADNYICFKNIEKFLKNIIDLLTMFIFFFMFTIISDSDYIKNKFFLLSDIFYINSMDGFMPIKEIFYKFYELYFEFLIKLNKKFNVVYIDNIKLKNINSEYRTIKNLLIYDRTYCPNYNFFFFRKKTINLVNTFNKLKNNQFIIDNLLNKKNVNVYFYKLIINKYFKVYEDYKFLILNYTNYWKSNKILCLEKNNRNLEFSIENYCLKENLTHINKIKHINIIKKYKVWLKWNIHKYIFNQIKFKEYYKIKYFEKDIANNFNLLFRNFQSDDILSSPFLYLWFTNINIKIRRIFFEYLVVKPLVSLPSIINKKISKHNLFLNLYFDDNVNNKKFKFFIFKKDTKKFQVFYKNLNEINKKKTKISLYTFYKKKLFFIKILDVSNFKINNRLKFIISTRKLEKKKDSFIYSFFYKINIENLKAIRFVNLIKIWTNLGFQYLYEKIKSKKVNIDVYYLWYQDIFFILKKSFMYNKVLRLKLEKIQILEIKEKYKKKKNTDLSLNGIFLEILNKLNYKKKENSNIQLSENLKLLEFFNFSNFSEYFGIDKDRLQYLDSSKKQKQKQIMPFFSSNSSDVFVLNKKKIDNDFNYVLKKKYKNINITNFDLYVKFEYIFKYLNYNQYFIPKIKLNKEYNFNISNLFKNIYFGSVGLVYLNDVSLSSKFKINFWEKEMSDNGYFDMKITNNLVNVVQNWIFYFFYFLKYSQQSNQKFQLLNFYSIYLEIVEFLFEPRKYTLLSTINKEKKRIITDVSEHSKKKIWVDYLYYFNNFNNFYFGDRSYSFTLFHFLYSFFIYEKKKIIIKCILLDFEFNDKLLLLLERQKLLDLLCFEFWWYFEYFINKNINLLIDLAILKIKFFIIWFKLYTMTLSHFTVLFYELNNKFFYLFLKKNMLILHLMDLLNFCFEVLFYITIIAVDFYFIKINYQITEYPFFYQDIKNVDISIWYLRNNFDFYYYTFRLNILFFFNGIYDFNLFVCLEYLIKNLNFLKNYYYTYMFNELDSLETFQGKEDFVSFLGLLDELKDIGFEKVSMGIRSYFENRGQLIWLDICIFFDYIFEILVTFDIEEDSNPFFRAIWQVIEVFRKISTGSFFTGYQFTGIDLEIRNSILKYYNKSGSDSQVATEFNIHSHNDVYFDENELVEENSRMLELGHFNGIDQVDDVSIFDFLGWGFNNNIGTNPGNEFSIINDFLEIPENLEKYFNFDISNWYHRVFGLDGPRLGELSPTFDVSLPIKSFWLIGVLYYEPKNGGLMLIDLGALWSFFIILFVDRRTSFFIKIYNIADFSYFQLTNYNFVLFKLKITYYLHDVIQILELVYINPFDFLEFFFFYLIFLINYFSVLLPIFIYFIFIIFGKINLIFEKKLRKYNYSSFILFNIVSQFYNYFIFRFLYLFISNSFLFLKMTASLLVILTILYVFSEGLHIFSILRLFSLDHEGTQYINGLYFLLERDPFVEKYSLNDEVWDQFKYDSAIDDEWSRIHYHREHAEILGGNNREQSALIDNVGFSKKLNIDYDIHDRGIDIETTPAKRAKSIIDQIHNRIPDEGSFLPRFINDSELEREFFREYEMFGTEVEGSLDWFSRSDNMVSEMWSNSNFSSYFYDTKIFDKSRFKSNKNLMQNNLYAALLMNFYDPKWVWDDGIVLSERINKPLALSHNKKELYNTLDDSNLENEKIIRGVIADNRIINLIKKNKGISKQSPILDFWDEDPYTDIGLEIQNDVGSSIGSQLNQINTWNTMFSDILTQKVKYSTDPSIGSGIFFNYISNNDSLPIDFYNSENLILENFIETLFNTSSPNTKNKHFPSEVVGPRYQEMYRTNKRLDTYDVYFKRNGRFPILEDNAVNNLFPKNDFLITDDLDYFTGVFIDINNYRKGKELKKSNYFKKNIQKLSLENIRRRDFEYKKLDGNDPVSYFYDEMIAEDIEKEIYRNLDNISGIAPKSFNSFYRNNEFVTKSNTNKKSIWTKHIDLELQTTMTEKDVSSIHELSDVGPVYDNLKEYPTRLKYMKFENYLLKLRPSFKENLQKKFIINNSIINMKDNVYKNRLNSIQKNNNFFLYKNKLNNINTNWNTYTNNEFTSWFNTQKYFRINKFNPNNLNYLEKIVKRDLDSVKSIYTDLKKKKDLFFDYEKKNIKISNLLYFKKYFEFVNKKQNCYDLRQKYTIPIEFNKEAFDWNVNRKINSILKNYIFSYKIKDRYKNSINVKDEVKTYIENKNILFNLKLNNKIKNIILKKNISYISNFNNKIFKEIHNKPLRTLNYFNLKNKLSLDFKKINKTFSNFSSNTYNKKISEYISKVGGQKIHKIDKNNNKNLSKLSIFFGDKWYLDNSLRLGYNLIDWKNNDFEIWESLGNLKKNNKNYKEKLFNRTRLSNEKHMYPENRGYWGVNSETSATTDLRMHGIYQIDHFPSPAYQNDDETFREYVETWNPNFGRLYNNLDYLGKGNVMNLKTYWYDHLIIDEEQEPWEAEPLDDHVEYYNPEKIFLGIKGKQFTDNQYPEINKNFYNSNSVNFLLELPKKTAINLVGGMVSKKYLKKINWYDQNLLNKIYLKKKIPWALDLKNDYFWKGPQYFNLEHVSESISPLFSKKYYSSNIGIDKSNTLIDNIDNKKHKMKILSNNSKNVKINKSINNYKYLTNNYNTESLNKGIKVRTIYDKKINIINNFDIEKKSLNADYLNFKELKNKNKKIWTHFKKIPGNASVIDIGLDSQVKESFAENQFEYGKNLISLKQHSLMQQFWDNNIPLQNRMITPKQGSDYFWYVYKKYKQNRIQKFWKKINNNKKYISNISNVTSLNWENKIKNPENKYSYGIFNNFLNKKIKKNELNLIDLKNTWISKQIYDRVYLKMNDYSLGLVGNVVSEDIYSKSQRNKKKTYSMLQI